jgi:hypothetical protein
MGKILIIIEIKIQRKVLVKWKLFNNNKIKLLMYIIKLILINNKNKMYKIII